MVKKKLEKKITEQVVCPDCGKAIDYKDIAKYKRGLPTGLMEMDFYDFLKQKAGIYEGRKKSVGNRRLANLCSILYDGRLYKEYVELSDNKYTTQWHEKKIGKVKDLYSLTQREIFAIQNMGKVTWDGLNKILEDKQLSPLKLPYQYTVTYPLKRTKLKTKN